MRTVTVGTQERERCCAGGWIIESQIGRSWKGLLKIIKFNTLPEQDPLGQLTQKLTAALGRRICGAEG